MSDEFNENTDTEKENESAGESPLKEEEAKGGDAPVYSQMSLEFVANQVNKAKKKSFLTGFFLSFGIFLLAAILYFGVKTVSRINDGSFYAYTFGTSGKNILDKETVDKINEIYAIIDESYIDEVDKDTIREGIYKGMLESLDDPYSVYYNEEEYEEMMEDTSGTFEGIGAYLSQDPDTMEVKVVRPIKGSPAEEAGILAGDIIVEVNKEDISGQDLNVVVSKVRGEAGSSVNIGIRREGEDDILYFDVERAKINAESVESEMLDENIGYIYISSFEDATGDQFGEAYDELADEGMEYLIIDLRSNGGGYVNTSVQVADKLIKEGDIVSIKNRYGSGRTYEDEGDDNYISVPCVVLVDGNTASASEILTGALKDYGIATVIGTQTFGKGIVQDVLALGDDTGMKITTSKYYTPNGNNIHGVGIAPDIEVGWDSDMYVNEEVDNQLEAAKEYLLKGKIDDKYIPVIEEDENEESGDE